MVQITRKEAEMSKHRTLVGFQKNQKTAIGVVLGSVDSSSLLVKVILPKGATEPVKISLRDVFPLGEIMDDESDDDAIERHCPQIVMFLKRIVTFSCRC